MTIRESLEQWEQDYLSPYASLSVNSKGTVCEPEEQCDIRPVFQTGQRPYYPLQGIPQAEG